MACGALAAFAIHVVAQEEGEGKRPVSEANTSIRRERLVEARAKLRGHPDDERAQRIVAKAEERPELFGLPFAQLAA